jgi:muramidase (phage lysozyme)
VNRAAAFAVGGAALLLFATLRGANAATVTPEAPEPTDELPPEDLWIDVPVYESYFNPEISMNAPLAAMLKLIRTAEHSGATLAAGLEYQTFYGGSLFQNMADHPVITGEKRGVKLSDAMCRNAGFGPGCVSTAAGAYQATRPTWREFREAGYWGPRLPDFSRDSQDEFARRVLLHDGALRLLDAGDWEGAIRAAGKRWASLPGSTAQQRPKSIEWALNVFSDALNNAG